jgi:C-terminal processing protease CtpA/Prc
MWTGLAVDTGLRARFIEDHLIVFKVLSESPGALAGVKPGDEILAIEGAEEVTPWGAQNRSGQFTFLTKDKTWDVKIEAAELKTDGEPTLTRVSATAALLDIPSFRSEYFDAEEWRALVGNLKAYRHVIIDIRENAGGNFVAMLRALSSFRCESQLIGTLLRSRFDGQEVPAFDDNTSDAYQIEVIESSSRVGLSTFPDYGCFNGAVTVLISAETSSVAEIFAQSFLDRPRSRVWGQPSAGDVVLAIWYDLPALGPGYSISIPEAVFVTPDNLELENRGVKPQKEIFYNLEMARSGRDTFIYEALGSDTFLGRRRVIE